ncbi:MAG: hypothetical protein EAZ77_07330 [Nostocales cyanobacterium]|nr:MAG: hypothetical protein EAZ77_07330 [Nostocales cyanobacterium]
MPQQVTDIETLKSYINGVMSRADHHAGDVNEISLALAGAIVWKKDVDPIEVMVRDGETKNVLWVKINNTRYAFSYNHNSGEIELRRASIRGDILHTFSNKTPLNQIKQIFESL